MVRYFLSLVIMVSILFSSVAAIAQDVNVKICKAAISTLMFQDPSIMTGEIDKEGVVHIYYKRASDDKFWAFKCKIEGNSVVYAYETRGYDQNWRPNEAVSYKVEGGIVTICDPVLNRSKRFSLY
jgi:hypothetical protein